MAIAQRAHIPSAEKIYNGTGKTLDDAIKDAHKQIPPRAKGTVVHQDTMQVIPPTKAKEGGGADVPIRCKVIDIRYESGGFTGLSTFLVRVVED
jgi:hypothetical protein